MKKRCMEILEEYQEKYSYIGIRFEDKKREIGDICECSKHNIDREDERDFPTYGTEEYDELFELDGTSAWNLETYTDYEDDFNKFDTYHCYIIGGNRLTNKDDGLDDNEIVIQNAVVIAQIF